jgi:hypothetical protein
LDDKRGYKISPEWCQKRCALVPQHRHQWRRKIASAEKEYPSCQPPRHPWLLLQLDTPAASWIRFSGAGGGSRQTGTGVPCSSEIFVVGL